MLLQGQFYRWRGELPACRLFLVLLLSTPAIPALAGPPSPSHEPERAVYFELDGPRGTGVLDPEKPVRLSVYLQGERGGMDHIVAIFEGGPFVRRLVPMRPEPGRQAFRSSVTLEPSVRGFVSTREKALRVNVILARRHGMRLTRFMSRTVYVTMRLPRKVSKLSTAPFSETKQNLPGAFWPDLSRVGGLGREEARDGISEQDLIVGSVQTRGQGYWRHISHLIGRSLREPLASSSRKKPEGTVLVRFRLHANGEVQLVQVERSSGIPRLDEAGMEAIISAHPFPPFPSNLSPANLSTDWIDMHVELTQSAPRSGRRHVPRPAP